MGPRAWMVLVPLAAALAYGSALANGFVWDDGAAIERGRFIGSLRNVPALFAHNTMWNSEVPEVNATAVVDTYRPLTMTTFAVDRAVFGLDPRGFHAVSLLIHAANALLLLLLGRRLGLGLTAAAGGALLFAVHPSISEAVHWINGRSDPLSVLCFLAAVLLWWPLLEAPAVRPRWARAAAVALLALAGTLCKETMFMLAGGLVLVVRHRRVPVSRAVGLLAPWAVGLGLGLLFRLLALGRPAAAGGVDHLAHAAARVLPIWRDALLSLLMPAPRFESSLYQHYGPLSPLGLALALLLVGAAVAAAVLAWRRGHLLGPWALATLLLTMAPVALLTLSEGWSGWGRYLYPGAPLACLTLAELVLTGLRGRAPAALRPLVAGIALLVVLASAAQTFASGRSWRDNESLAEAWIEERPASAVGYATLALAYYEAGKPDRALPLFRRAVELAPQVAENWAKLAMGEAALGQREAAGQHAQRALALNPRNRLGRYTLAWTLLGQGRQAEAAERLVVLLAEQAGEDAWRLAREAWTRSGPGSPFRQRVQQMAGDPRYRFVLERLGREAPR